MQSRPLSLTPGAAKWVPRWSPPWGHRRPCWGPASLRCCPQRCSRPGGQFLNCGLADDGMKTQANDCSPALFIIFKLCLLFSLFLNLVSTRSTLFTSGGPVFPTWPSIAGRPEPACRSGAGVAPWKAWPSETAPSGRGDCPWHGQLPPLSPRPPRTWPPSAEFCRTRLTRTALPPRGRNGKSFNPFPGDLGHYDYF